MGGAQMRLIPWGAMQPDDATSGVDKERLEQRLAKLVGGPAATEVSASTATEVNRANQRTDGAAPVPGQVEKAIVPDPGKPAPVIVPNRDKPAPVTQGRELDGGTAAPVGVGVVQDAVARPVKSHKRGDDVGTSSSEKARRRRRKAGFLLFFAGLILVFFLVRAIPADWEIGPFRIDVSGNAADPEASLYFADDPHAPFWLLVPTFNLPPRFFAARPKPSSQPVALAPTPTATGLPSASASASASPSGSPQQERQGRTGTNARITRGAGGGGGGGPQHPRPRQGGGGAGGSPDRRRGARGGRPAAPPAGARGRAAPRLARHRTARVHQPG